MTQDEALPWVLEPPHHGHPIPPAPMERWPTAEALVNIACDIQPDIGDDAPDVALGDWCDVMDVTRPAHKKLLVHALALCGLSCAGTEPTSPLRRFLNNGAQKKLPTRGALSSVLRTPMGLWRVTEQCDDKWRLQDLIDMEPAWTPEGPVDLSALATVSSRPIACGDTVCARILPTYEGHTAVIGFYVEGAPCESVFEGWRQTVIARHHQERPNGSIGCAVSRHGHLLARRLHQWAWHDA